MSWPSSQDYNEAVQDAANSFADPGLKSGGVVVNALGLPVPRSGNFADVYEFTDAAGKRWAIKCFTRKVPGLRERYAKIDDHLAKAKLPFAVGFKFLEQGIRVRGQWYPLLKMEWVEGFTLNDFVADNLSKPHYLHALVQMWAKLSGRLRDANMAHADLQHGNVLLVPGATPQKLGLKLIDYDGMWVPALAETHSGEIGHPNYQHPLRLKDRLYNGEVDRFPHLVVAAGLRAALVGGKAVWDRFDNGDNLLFKEADLRDPGSTPVFKALWELNDPVLRSLVGHIALSAKQPLRLTPWLDDVLFAEGGPKLTAEQERQVKGMLGVVDKPSAAPPPLPQLQQEFNVFEFLGDDEEPAERGPGRAVPAVRRPAYVRKKSPLPWLIGGGVLALLLVAGGVFAAMKLGKKGDPTTEVAQGKEKEPPPPSTTTVPPPVHTIEEPKNPPIIPKKPVDPDPDPEPGPKGEFVVGISPLPAGRDYLFYRGDDKAVYRSVNGLGRNATVVARLSAPVERLVVAPDGSKAVALDEEGEMSVVALGASSAAPDAAPIVTFDSVADARYSMAYFADRVELTEASSGQKETVRLGLPGQPTQQAFAANLRNIEKLAERLGPALTGEVVTFDGRLKVQVFEGGAQFYVTSGTKTAYVYHPKLLRSLGRAPEAKVTRLEGRHINVTDLAIAPDGKRALAAEKSLVHLYDLETGLRLDTFEGLEADAVAYLPGGQSFLAGTSDGDLVMWSLVGKPRETQRVKDKDEDDVRAIHVSESANIAWSVHDSGKFRIWKLPSLEPVATVAVAGLAQVSVSPEGRILAARLNNEQLRMFDARSGQPLQETGVKRAPTRTMAFSREGELIAGRAEPVRLRIAVEPTKMLPPVGGAVAFERLHQQADKPTSDATSFVYSDDGKHLIIRRQDAIEVLDAVTGSRVGGVRPVGLFGVHPLQFGPGTTLYCTTKTGNLEIWDWKASKLLREFAIESAKVDGPNDHPSILPTGVPNRLLVVGVGESALWLDVSTGKVVDRVTPVPGLKIDAAAFYPGGGRIAFTIRRPGGTQVSIWDVAKRMEAFNIDGNGYFPTHLQVSPNGKWLIANAPNQVWDATTGRPVRIRSLPGYFTGGFLADGDHFALISLDDKPLSVVDLANDRLVAQDLAGGFQPNRVGSSPKHNLVAAVGDGGRIRLLRVRGAGGPPAVMAKNDPKTPTLPKTTPDPKVEVKTGLLRTSKPLTDTVRGVAFSSSGTQLHVATRDGVVHVLDVAELGPVGRMEMPKTTVDLLAMRPRTRSSVAGDRLFILDDVKMVHVWDAEKRVKVKQFSIEKGLADGERVGSVVVSPSEGHFMGFETSRLRRAASVSWDIAGNKPGVMAALRQAPFAADTRQVAFSPDGLHAAAWASGKLMVWQVQTGTFRMIDDDLVPAWLGVMPEAGVVVSVGYDHINAYAYGPASKPTLTMRRPHGRLIAGEPIHAAAPQKGPLMVTAGADRKLRAWDVKEGRETDSWDLERPPAGVAMSADGRYAAVWNQDDNTVALWGLAPPTKEKK